jgi:hypothetical protein
MRELTKVELKSVSGGALRKITQCGSVERKAPIEIKKPVRICGRKVVVLAAS